MFTLIFTPPPLSPLISPLISPSPCLPPLSLLQSLPLLVSPAPSNVTWWEATTTIILATLVCVIAALLFNVNFYQDFWVFWFCFVVGTAHFSLVKVAPIQCPIEYHFQFHKANSPISVPSIVVIPSVNSPIPVPSIVVIPSVSWSKFNFT